MRITKVYTKSGDAGETSLVSGDRVSKASLRVSAFGDVDELNSVLGLARSVLDRTPIFEQIDLELATIQNDLFILGCDLASPSGTQVPRVSEEMITEIEGLIDSLLEELEPLKEFILPGGNQAASFLHLARTVARRAERLIVLLSQNEEINSASLIYLNRLSDYLFVVARVVNARGGTAEHLANFSARKH